MTLATKSPLVTVSMRLGYSMRLDLRSRTERSAYVTRRYNDRLIRAAQRLQRRRGGLVIDAGANIGFWTLPLARRAAQLGGSVLAIEPVPTNAARLRENMRLNGVANLVTLKELALSDRHGNATMTLREDFEQESSTGNAAVHIRDDLDSRFTTLGVKTAPLDSVLEKLGPPLVELMKVDVEGHEDRFFKGAVETMKTWRPVAFVEWNRAYYERRGVDLTAELTPLLESLSYVCLLTTGGGWAVADAFFSPRPLDDLVIAPRERHEEVLAALKA